MKILIPADLMCDYTDLVTGAFFSNHTNQLRAVCRECHNEIPDGSSCFKTRDTRMKLTWRGVGIYCADCVIVAELETISKVFIDSRGGSSDG